MRVRALGVIAVLLAACVDVASSRRAALLGACTFNDDCESPLVCAAGRCRARCRTDRDCTNAWRCLSAGQRDTRVCYAPDDYANACLWDSECRGGRICGGDRVCRTQCLADYDCQVIAPGLRCVPPGVCSSHPFLDGGALGDVDLNLVSAPGDVVSLSETGTSSDAPVTDAPVTDAPITDAPITDAPVTDAGMSGPAEMPTAITATGCGPRSDPRSCAPGTPGCAVVEVQASREANARCARFSDGSVRCWSSALPTNLGIGSIAACQEAFIAQRLHGASQVELSAGSGCALFTRGVWCWGSNWQNNVGLGMSGERHLVPVAIGEAPDGLGTLVSGHGNTTCLVRPDGALRCWGQNTHGELGQGDTMPRVGAVTVPLTEVLAVSPGETHTCAIRRDRSVWCWGANCAGEIGRAPVTPPTNTTIPRCTDTVSTPTQVMGLSDVQELATGRYFSCARRGDGQVLCWGWNNGGELGRGSAPANGYDTQARPVLGINDAQRLASGDGFGACVIRADRTVWCWGGVSSGGGGGPRGRPFQIPTLTSVRELAPRAPCVVLMNGELWCWAGAVGDPMVSFAATPTRVRF